MEKKVTKKDDFIGKELAKYNLPDAVIGSLKKKYLPCKVKDIEDIDNYLIAKAGHSEVKGLRVDVEKKRIELKSSSLAFGRAVDSEAKRLTGMLLEVENHLMTQRKVIEDEKARIKRECEEAEQKERERKQREEEERLENIRLEQEEKERKIQEAQEKIEAEKRQIAEEKEQNRLEKERIEKEKKDAAVRKLREEQEKKDKVERKIKEGKDRVEREKQHTIEIEKAKKKAAEQAKKEAEEKARHEAEERREKELAKNLEAERQEALKPDREKIKDLAKRIETFQYPEVKSNSAQRVVNAVKREMLEISKKLLDAEL